MIKIKQKIKELESKISALEKRINQALELSNFSHRVEQNQDSSTNLTYKEVLDEWLNGKTR